MMKYIKSGFLVTLILISLVGCTGKSTPPKQEEVVQESNTVAKANVPLVIDHETTTLIKYLEANGDYVNSNDYPSLIKASVVKESLEQNILILDLRPSEKFSKGHIKGAVSKQFEDLPTYFETEIRPFEYDKIILVSDDGQISSYTTALLRLMGYGNVFAMRWGMSGWNSDYAKDGWLKGVSGKFEGNLEVKTNEKPVAEEMPELKTGLENGEEIADARFRKVFSDGTKEVLISAEDVFSNPQNYFVVNLERKDKYDDGHVPGAVRFKPDATLGFVEEMASIPADKIIVVYCGTGHNSGLATAYLRLLGYDARTLKYGNNGFMYNKMVKQKQALSWVPFSTDDVNNYEVVK
jgi:rhodanese-related sulfurtransferase